jgi:hypothetical protein
MSRSFANALAAGSNFQTLLERHLKWIKTNSNHLCAFAKGAELAEFEKLRSARFRAMESLGFIRFTNASKTHWKYTLTGALRVSALNYSIGLLRAVTFGKFPKEGR